MSMLRITVLSKKINGMKALDEVRFAAVVGLVALGSAVLRDVYTAG